MSKHSEDVYDLAPAQWCRICETAHEPCEPDDLRFECFECHKLIDEEDLFDNGVLAFHKYCWEAEGHKWKTKSRS